MPKLPNKAADEPVIFGAGQGAVHQTLGGVEVSDGVAGALRVPRNPGRKDGLYVLSVSNRVNVGELSPRPPDTRRTRRRTSARRTGLRSAAAVRIMLA